LLLDNATVSFYTDERDDYIQFVQTALDVYKLGRDTSAAEFLRDVFKEMLTDKEQKVFFELMNKEQNL
jgi:hypothetical protein